MANTYFDFYYDPARDGYTTTAWKTLSGTPAVATGQLQFNAASAVHFGNCLRGEYRFYATVPAAPTSGDSRQIGLEQPTLGAYAYFDITGAVFSAKVADGEGNTQAVTLAWQTAFTNTLTKFTIRWEGGTAKFMVNDRILATINDIAVPNVPLSIFINNGNSDNLRIKAIDALGIQAYTFNQS